MQHFLDQHTNLAIQMLSSYNDSSAAASIKLCMNEGRAFDELYGVVSFMV